MKNSYEADSIAVISMILFRFSLLILFDLGQSIFP